jgi:c-di-GMP-binding flagellar brake protein YcgR
LPKKNVPEVERRRWKRVPVDVRVKVLVAEGNGQEVVHGRSLVIGEGGMGVMLTRELPKGTTAMLVFSLPGEKSERSLRALLKYRKGFHCGFEFGDITAEQQRQLRSFCVQAEKKG